MLNRKEFFEEAVEDLMLEFKKDAKFNLHERSKRTKCKKIIFPIHAVERLADVFKRCIESHCDTREIYFSVSKALFQIVAKHSGLEIVGDKVPDYTYIPDVVCDPHPDMNILCIFRDPYAVVHSALELNRKTLHLFATPNSFAMAFSIALREMGMREFYKKFPKSRVIRISQHDLRNAPLKIVENALTSVERYCRHDDYHRMLQAKSFFLRGRIEKLEENMQKAREYFQSSLEIFPQFRLAQKMLASIQV